MSPFTLNGSAVRAELTFDKLKVWSLLEGTRKTIRTDRILSVTIEPNGYTKLNLAFRKDILLPTSQGEAAQLVKELNTIISEKTAVKARSRAAAHGIMKRSYVSGYRRK